MDFSGDLAAIQRQLAECHDMVARRVAVLDAGVGEKVLEVGCGAGSYLNPDLPVRLPSLLAHGSTGVAQRPVTILNRHFHANTFSWGAARLMAAFAITTGAIDQAEATAWFDSLDTASSRGEHFPSSVPVLTTASAVGQGTP